MSVTLSRKFEEIKNEIAGHHGEVDPAYEGLVAATPPKPIENQTDYKHFIEILKLCARIARTKRMPPRILRAVDRYARVINALVRDYEQKKRTPPKVTQGALLQYLLDEHGKKQADIAGDLGGQPVVSAVIRGKRALSQEQMHRLGKRFGLPARAFLVPKGPAS